MRKPDKETLEDFALKSMHLAKMTGVSTATHAIGDGFLLMHTGVGCKFKTAAQIAQHDWVRHPNRREAWTQIGEVSLIQGSGARIGPFARSWYERRRPGFMAVVSAYFIELTGEDIRDLVRDTEKTLPCAMGVVSTAAPNGGFFDGYSEVMLAVAQKMDWTSPPTAPRGAAALGFFFHRYEPDQAADLAQLKALVKVAGLELGSILFSGATYADLTTAPQAGWILQLPYAYPKRRKFKRLLKKRQVVSLDLPIGIRGTSRFVRELASATGADSRVVEAWIDKQIKAIEPHVTHMVGGFHGLRIALFADTPLAAGLASLLREMGAEIAIVGLRDDVLGGTAAFFETLAKNEIELNEDCRVLKTPSLRKIREEVIALSEQRELHAIVGSAIELNLFAHAPRVRGALSRTALIEAGFPSKDQHAALPTPTLGYRGALVWAQKLIDAILTPRMASRAAN